MKLGLPVVVVVIAVVGDACSLDDFLSKENISRFLESGSSDLLVFDILVLNLKLEGLLSCDEVTFNEVEGLVSPVVGALPKEKVNGFFSVVDFVNPKDNFSCLFSSFASSFFLAELLLVKPKLNNGLVALWVLILLN